MGIQKFFSFQVPMNIQKDWKAKLESAYSFMLKYYKITVCAAWQQIASAATSKLIGSHFKKIMCLCQFDLLSSSNRL